MDSETFFLQKTPILILPELEGLEEQIHKDQYEIQ